VSIMLITFAVVFLTLARGPLSSDGATFARAIGAGFAVTTALVFWLARHRPAGLLHAPMWVLFVAMSVLSLAGASA
jgi:hypothetical protein